MLVLSRRPDEKILLPSVPAVIQLISSQAGLARLGIEAPANVPILREELARSGRAAPSSALLEAAEPGQPSLRHFVRNRMHNLFLGLALLRMQLVDCDPVVRKTLEGLEEELQALRRQVAPAEVPAALIEPA
jgi:sRNA-binding carbon storage regulator CsrA